jgi:hypothetical protein
MDAVVLFVKLLPWLLAVACGFFCILTVFFPSLRDTNFDRWKVWTTFTVPRVVAQGQMSERTACAVSLSAGILLIAIGFIGIRHIAGYLNLFQICSASSASVSTRP